MRNPAVKNLPASIQSKLLTLAQKNQRPYNELLQYYAIERVLYRLGQSKYGRKFLLMDALLFQAWGLTSYRPTRGIDLLGYASNEVETLVRIIRDICTLEVQADGLVFYTDSVRGERITEDADYQGVRVRFQGHLGDARLHLTPACTFRSILGLPMSCPRARKPEISRLT